MFQRITLVGNLGRDPEKRFTAQGRPVTNFSLAVSNKARDEAASPLWFQVTAWGALAEVCAEYLARGQQVLVEGELRADPATGAPRTWTRKDGSVGVAFEVNAGRVVFLGKRGEAGESELEKEDEAVLSF